MNASAPSSEKRFWPTYFVCRIALEALRHGELPQKITALRHAEHVTDATRLELILQPQALLRIRNMRKFSPDRTCIDVFELRQNVAQLHLPGDRRGAAAGEELGLQIALREAK